MPGYEKAIEKLKKKAEDEQKKKMEIPSNKDA